MENVSGADAVFREGIAHFNALRFWEAHESWEQLWLEADGELVDFYQGLIQLAAAYHHMRRGTFSGAVRLFDASIRRLEGYSPRVLGLDRELAMAAAETHRTAALERKSLDVSEYPKLGFASG